MQFLYFIKGVLPDDLTPIGLSHLGFGGSLARTGAEVPGPDGSGLIVGLHGTPQTLRYAPDEQTWKRAPGGKFWVGYWNNQRPHPGSLRLKDALPGKPMKLLDGNEWEILQSRRHIDDGWCNALPRIMTLDDSGRWVQGETTRPYREFWRLANKSAPLLFGGTEEQVQEADQYAFDAVVMSLAMTYRVSAVEIDLLELLDMRTAGSVLSVILDFEGFTVLAKKLISRSESTAPSGLSGAEQSTPAANAVMARQLAN